MKLGIEEENEIAFIFILKYKGRIIQKGAARVFLFILFF